VLFDAISPAEEPVLRLARVRFDSRRHQREAAVAVSRSLISDRASDDELRRFGQSVRGRPREQLIRAVEIAAARVQDVAQIPERGREIRIEPQGVLERWDRSVRPPDSLRITPSLLYDPGVRVSPAVGLDSGPPSPM